MKKLILITAMFMATSIWADTKVTVCESDYESAGAYYKFEFETPVVKKNLNISRNGIGRYTELATSGQYLSGEFAYYLRSDPFRKKIFIINLQIIHKSGLEEILRFDPVTMKSNLSNKSSGFSPETTRSGKLPGTCVYLD